MDVVYELLVTRIAVEKLASRGISEREVQQLLSNAHVGARNAAGDGVGRRFLIGRTDGGKVVTLVIERTFDPATWLVITGWIATPIERKMLD